MQPKKYKFSVVIPVYNTEAYLRETVESILNQTINFKNNIQIIFVNDGSKDNSKNICLEYKEKFPDNIIYIEQENSGVSVARNNGMKHIEGEYVNFLDSDDKWDKHAFKKIYNFFKSNDSIEIASGRMKFFEAIDDYHPLDYKFEKTKIIDILKDYDLIQLHITSTFIKSDLAQKYRFDSRLKYGEDAEYLTEIILDQGKYGVVKEAVHFYRKRLSENSAIQTKEFSLDWYTKTIEYFYKNIMKISEKKYGKVIEYVQYILMYDIRYRLKDKLPDFLDNKTKNKYINDLKEILQKINDKVLVSLKKITAEAKIYLLSLKYGKNIVQNLEYNNGRLYYNGVFVYKIKNNKALFKVDILEIKNGKLILEGRIQTIFPKEMFEIYINEDKLDLEEGKKSIFGKNAYIFEKQMIFYYTFKTEINLNKIKKISFAFKYKNNENKLFIKFGKFGKLSEYSESYYIKDEYILKRKTYEIKVIDNTYINRLKRKLKNSLFLIKKFEFRVLFIRILYNIFKIFNKKDIWLISDRDNVADDNGEIFFKYVNTIKDNNLKSYFVLDKKSADFRRVKNIGKIISPNTLKNKIYSLLASKIISSQANDYVINAFGNKEMYFKDLENFDFIFLQHGITKDNLSSWLKKYDKNIKLFVTSAKKEYKSILEGDYYYTKNEVKLTGLPRFDRLEDRRKKTIIVWPTQRRALVEWNPQEKKDFSYNPYFKDSECYKFYNNLINDERIIDALQKNGYKMKLALHPLQQKQAKDFIENEYVEVIKETVDFNKEFSENSLLITDYSSVAFDFAYLKKKVIYTQFDREDFFKGQVYEEGYFKYDEDGFGPVCYDYESTVKEIIKALNNDCKLEDEYLKRIKDFYYKFDRENSKRVYEEIIKL